MCPFGSHVRMGICVRMSQSKELKKKTFEVNRILTNNWHTSDLLVGNEASKVCLLAKYDHFLAANVSFMNPC